MTSIATRFNRETETTISHSFVFDETEASAEFIYEGVLARTLPDFPGYAFTSDGRAISFKRKEPRELKHGSSASGCYCYVNIGRPPLKESQLLHILTARAFAPNPEGKPQVNHKDGRPSNNAASNLEWVTQSENVRHAHELRKEQGRSIFKTTPEQRTQVIALCNGGMSIAEASRQLGLPYEVARYTVNSAKRRNATI
ncbi:HNH endonuclease signature motif containing protein [Pseudomonas sp. O230]|uniref:HNH endonuclease signature motif containing protein n=1 Tax=Pseudomonas sp. O230 TaxID=3159450 RepID=UPI00387B30EF